MVKKANRKSPDSENIPWAALLAVTAALLITYYLLFHGNEVVRGITDALD